MAKERLKRLILLVLVLINLAYTCKGFDDELEMLLSLKASINDQSQALTNWNSSISYCNWNGITCFDSSHVSKIDLPGHNLSGKIPESIFKSPYIQSIDLSNNHLFGDIPNNLSSCFSLRYLNLSGNNLTGLIPSAQYLPALETLDLSNNMLSGEIPVNIGLFSGLRVLDFGGNALTGEIPGSVTNMTGLEFFTLASNQLTGEIPGRLGLMKSLKWIYFGYNNLSGQIPGEIGELNSLSHLDLVYNNLTGQIPSSLGNLTNLEYLFLYFNKLSGPIPKSISNLEKLVSLDLSDNLLSGEIPEILINLKKLEILQLFSNNFSGKIPHALSSLPRLRVLQLWSNRLSGEIPSDLGKYNNNLTVLDLSTNNLTGKIPESICASGQLFKLILFSNSLEGEIPLSLSRCKSLQRVRIQQNRLSGEVPEEFTTLPLVYFLDISSNFLSGRIDNRKWDMPQLQMLSLAGNGLFGPLPDSFGSKKLESLDLSGNNFSGRVPERFGEFSEIMELKLSENQLSGQIPDQLSSCKKLVSLDLSRNRFFGEIPVSFADFPVLGQLDLSVNELTGKVPGNLGKIDSLVQVNISHNHFHGSLPLAGAFLAMNSTSVIGNNLCGGEKITGLPPCDNSKNRVRWFVITFLLASLMTFAVVVLVAILLKRGKLFKGSVLKTVESKDGTWELQLFNWRLAKSIAINDVVSSIKEENIVASGKTGFSYKGKSKLSNKVFLAKEIASVSASNYWMEWIKLCKINHPNVVKMLAMCRSEKVAILVYEYIEGKNLSDVIGCLSWGRRIKVAVGIARALKYLHSSCSPSVIVGEVTPRKIMVDEKGEAHLRLSLPGVNVCSDSKCFSSSAYVAPEIKLGSKELMTEKSDIYGFGLLLIELLTGKSPCDTELGIHESIVEWARYCYSDCHLEMWVDTIIKNDQVLMEDHQNKIVETMNLALQCTAADPAARPCADNLVKNLESVVRSSSCHVFFRA
ncbi:probably inactive leucine-rich repeat receptor-like protein kinase at2g25790 [Phtheirospermum japonicum]|uniref:Probably inactive leucine-rich repeat receptor-like protein kinase at2g25790 n=1 Tax=Phtheirospermum japonicum TaxID=374723 RepID=A0A830CHT1_9LAMI|nr:probably inactive leucine-rich repeat receptor-like protein kinase at2g25790 [Phtheirospermum japonicum]